MKKLSQIKESVWSDIHKRSNGKQVRKEDGKKVKTCLGIDVVLKNPECDYDNLIKTIIIGSDSEYAFGIHNIRDFSYSIEEIANMRKFVAPYTYMIYDGGHGTDLIGEFSTYQEILDFNLDDKFEQEFCEEDYISICKTIATKYKEVGDCLKYVPSKKAFMISSEKEYTSKYETDYVFELISESEVYNWLCDDIRNEEYDDTYLISFKEDIIYEFPELTNTDFICWSYSNYGGCYVGIPSYNINNLLNIRKYIEFTKKWFNV